MRIKSPCHNCTMRYVAEQNGKIFSCHSECPQYRAFKKEVEKENQLRKEYFAQFTEQFVERKYQVDRALHKKQRRFYS